LAKVIVFIAGLALGIGASAVAGPHAASFGVSVEVVPTGSASIAVDADTPVLQVGGQRVVLQGNGTAVATVEY
jgi:hypothetical protein